MPESPATPTPYEVLGVSASVSQEELRRAYRRMLRESHPDTGGDAGRFRQVQQAWRRVGDPADRAVYDSEQGSYARVGANGDTSVPTASRASASSPDVTRPRRSGSPKARSYGHPGGQARERYLALIHEWVGRGTALADPYETTLVRSAPPEIRRLLAKALAEEATAQQVASLGIGYTVWNAVEGWDAGYRIDHIVLGPAGLFALRSVDWGTPMRLLKGEVEAADEDAGDVLARGEEPVKTLMRNARKLGKAVGVRFTGYLIVVPDRDAVEPVQSVERGRTAGASLVSRSMLPAVLRGDAGAQSGRDPVKVADVFEVRTRLQRGVKLV